MYCGECGFKNQKGDRFCAECGKPLQEEKTTPKKKVVSKQPPKPRKPMSKKTKIGIIIGIIVIVLGIIGYNVGSSMTSPKKVALNFFEATVNYDADALYSYLDVEQNEFTSKKVFKKIVERMKKEDNEKVMNYKVTNVEKSSSGLYANVTINYTVDGDSDDHSETIRLSKTKNKKFLFFDEWKVAVNNTDTVDDFELTVIKDSEVTLEGVKVDSKYLDKKESSDSYDVYVLPALLPIEYEVEVKLPYGFTVTDTIYPDSYSTSKTIDVDMDSFPEKETEKLEKQIKTDLTTLYSNAIEGKSYEDVKSNFSYDGDANEMSEVYDDLKEDLTSSLSKLTNIEYESVDLTDIEIDEDGLLSLSVRAKFKYTISYEENGETKTKSTDDNDTMYLSYGYQDGSYKIVDASSLQTYFSRYF